MYYLIDTATGDVIMTAESRRALDDQATVIDGSSVVQLVDETTDGVRKRIVNGALVDKPLPDDEAAEEVREARDRLLARADGRSLKHQEQVALVGTTPDLSDAQYQLLLQYKQDLRDIPTQAGFPQTVTYPTWPL